MVRRRIGNDIDIEWGVYRGDTPEDFTGKSVKVFIIERCGKKQQVDNSSLSISGSTISFTWKAVNQYSIGNYSIILEEYIDNELCNTVDIADAIELVANTALEDGDADYIADSSVTFRSDFNVVFNSIDKAYTAAQAAYTQAIITDEKTDSLIVATAAAEKAYNNIKEILETNFGENTGGTGDTFWEEDENGDLVPKPKVDGTLRGLKAPKLYLPNDDGTDVTYRFFIGELGDGSDIPESGGGGSSDVTFNSDNEQYGVLSIDGEQVGVLSLNGHTHSQYLTAITKKNVIDALGSGTVEDNVHITGVLSMNTLILPDMDGQPTDFILNIGELGDGSDIPESGGGGVDVSSIEVYDTNGTLLGNGNDEGNIIIAAYPDLTPYATKDALTTGLSSKQNVISDLETIRSGATLGATAIQPEIFNEELGKKYDKTGGEISGDVDITGSLRMGTLILPNKSGTEGDYELYVGELGDGSDTPEGGGGASNLWELGDVSIVSPADGESLVYDLASGKWVNRLVEGGGLDENALWAALATNDSNKVIDISHIPNLSWNKITSDKPTTLSGYGITDWVVLSGSDPHSQDGDPEFWISCNGLGVGLITSNHPTAMWEWGKTGLLLDDDITLGHSVKINGRIVTSEGYDMLYPDLANSTIYIGSGIYTTAIRSNGTFTHNGKTILDSGNIGNYNAGSATKATKDGDGNIISSTYLKKNGDGEIIGTTNMPLSLRGNTSSLLRFKIGSSSKGTIGWSSIDGMRMYNQISYSTLGVDDDGIPYYSDSNGTTSTLIHSGNVGDYVLFSRTPVTLGPSHNLNNYVSGYYGYINAYNPSNSYGDNTAVLALQSVRGIDTWQLAFDGNGINRDYGPRIGIRGNFADQGWTQWFTLATLNSNVASATKLQTTRTIWGQSFDGTGNVDGSIAINSDAVLERKSSAVWLNYGPANKNENLYLFGYNTQLYYGTASGYRIAIDINSSGNVGIGITNPSSKLQVAGNIYASGYQLPTSAPSSPVSGGYYLYVGSLGAGATIS